MIISEIIRRWFRLDPVSCLTCDVLREALSHSERERRELLIRLLEKDKPIQEPVEKEEFKPIQPQFTPWRVRQQMLEQEDRKAAQLMRDRKKEIADLEKELQIPVSEANNAGKVS